MRTPIFRREQREAAEAIAAALVAIVFALAVTLILGEVYIGAEHSVLIGWPR